MKPTTVAAYIAGKVASIETCEKAGYYHWRDLHAEDLVRVVKEGPSGSGWDCGTSFDKDRSNADKLVFFGLFHHMHESGMYDGWTEHQIIVTPSFTGINLKVTGRNRNDIKDYLGELFHHWLVSTVDAGGAIITKSAEVV